MKSIRGLLQQAALLALLCASLTTFASTAFAQGGMFVPTGSLNTARSGHTATLLNNGKVLVAGGEVNSTFLASAELYDPTTGTFTATGNMSAARVGHTTTLLNNGKVLVAGGVGNNNVLFASAELYDPATGTFTPTGSMSTARSGHTATLLNSGKVLIAGWDSSTFDTLATAELYDPTTGTFAPTGSMNTARFGHSATLLNSGKVLIVGGARTVFSDPGRSAELYDPATGAFTATGSMTNFRASPAATLLNNGKVLVAGGDQRFGNPGGSAELYDPATGTFTPTGSMNSAFHTATLLNNGTVLVAVSFANNLAELYDAATGTFTPTGSMNAVVDATATLLNNGTVLFAESFFTGNTALGSAELYELVVLSPTSLSFSNQVVGTTSASQTVTLTNNQSTALSITSIATSGTNASDFAETNNCVGSVPAGASCSISVTFTPAAAGSRTGSLTIANNLSGRPVPVPLTGTTATRIASLSTSSLTFTGQIVGTSSAAQMLTLSSTGNSALIISNVGISGTNASEFAETDNCGGSVAAGASCTINVTFSPAAAGTRTGTLSITDNATDSPQSPQTVALTGTGQDFSLAPVSPAATTISAGQTANFTVTVSPAGGFNQLVALACTGAPPLSTCAVTPNAFALNGSAASMVAVNVTTTAASPPVTSPSPRGDYRPVYLIIELLVLSLLIGLLNWHGGRRPRLAYGLALLLCLCAGVMMSACGGGGGGGGGNQRTPAGTYTVVVSGTFTSGSTSLTHKVNLNLMVQ
jgi:hypothetical protein